MLASISNISRITELDRKVVEDLVNKSDRGKAILENVFVKVLDIANLIGKIQEMVVIIENIAAETRLLATDAFQAISLGVHDVNQSITEIYSNISEISIGSHQIMNQ